MAGITLEITVDDKGTPKIKQISDEAKKAFEEMKKGHQSAQVAVNNLKNAWIGLTAKLTAASAVIYGVTQALSSFVNEAARAEEIENRLRYALETTGYTWQYAKQAVDEFASSIQKTTRFSDEQARQALTDMMLYTSEFAKAQEGARLAMDMSIRTGQDLSSTTRLIGMAMSGNVEMLGRYIPELRNLGARLGENASNADKAAYAMKVLNEKFGGTAQADLSSYSAQLAQLKNAWSDLKETLGMHLLPVLKDVYTWFKKVIDIGNEWAGKGKEKSVLGQLRSDLKEAERSISVYEEFLRQAETARPGTPYRLGPEAMQEAKERLYMWRDWAKYLREQIKAEEEAISGRIAAETKKDVFPEKKVEALKLSTHWMIELWQAEDKYFADSIAKSQEVLDLTHRRNLALQTQDEWLDTLAGSWESTWLKAKLYEEAVDEAIDANQRAIPELLKTTSELQSIWENLAANLSSSWDQNMSGILRGTQSWSEGMKNIFKSMGDVFISTVSKMITQWLLFGSITGGKNKITGEYGGLVGLISGWLKHEGGIVGEPGPTRYVPEALFAGAPRFHTGLMPGEYPAILKRGEGVFTPAQMKALGGSVVNINIINKSDKVRTDYKESEDGRGNRQIEIVISEIVAGEAKRYGSALNKSLISMGSRNELIRR